MFTQSNRNERDSVLREQHTTSSCHHLAYERARETPIPHKYSALFHQAHMKNIPHAAYDGDLLVNLCHVRNIIIIFWMLDLVTILVDE